MFSFWPLYGFYEMHRLHIVRPEKIGQTEINNRLAYTEAIY